MELSQYLKESILDDEADIISKTDGKVINDYKLSKANIVCKNFDEAYRTFIELLGDNVKGVQELKSDKLFGIMPKHYKYYMEDGYIANKGSKIINVSDKGSIRILFALYRDKLVVQPIYYKSGSNRIEDYGTNHGVYVTYKWGRDKLIDWLSKSDDEWLLKFLNIERKS